MTHEIYGYDYYEGYYSRTLTDEIFAATIYKEADTFKLNIYDGDIILKGDWKESKNKIEIKANKISIDDETINGISAAFIICKKDNMPSPLDKAKITNIFDINKSNLERIEKNLTKLFEFLPI